MIACIYKITNIITGQIYIGSTYHFKKRRREHFGDLSRGKHGNPKLQRSYNINVGNIASCCSSKIFKTVGGYKWMHKI